jgi:hypothetical protein
LLFSALSPEILGASLVLLVLGFIMLILAAIVRNPPAQQAQQVYYVLPGGGQQPIPYPTGQYVPTGGSSTPTPAYVPTPPGKRSPKAQKPSQSPPRPSMDYIQTGAPRSGRPPGATPRRAQDHKDVDQSIPVEVITPTPVPGSKTPSGIDRFKDDLEQSDIPNDQTFIPGEQPSSDPGDSESDQ